ncbi:MAG TPA: hypothetical protein VG206_12440 [Terriglobia bacterium]|nr:hypothetical protein [Terriglobia bacterium]
MGRTAAVIAFSLWLSLPLELAEPQSTSGANQSAPATEAGGADLGETIERVARAAGQPIGWVVASDDSKPCPVTKVVVFPGDPSSALDQIAEQCTRYTWARHGLSFVIQPVGYLKDIVDLRVHDFSYQQIKASDAESAVRALPEVKQWLQANGLRELTVEPGTKWMGVASKFPINLHDVPLHEILDEIALQSGRMTWRIVWLEHDTYLGIYL